MTAALAISEGTDAIVHLGGYAGEGPWETILKANIIGCYNVFEAARRNGVTRLVFASSNHALGFYKCDQKVDHRVYPKPDTRYGVSKAFGEMLGSLYADKYGLEVFLIRIGHASPTPGDLRGLAMWISARDLAQLVAIGIDHPDVRFEIVYGVSGNTRSWSDNSNAERLGYVPQDDFRVRTQPRSSREETPAMSSSTAIRAGNSCARSSCLFPASLAWQQQRPSVWTKVPALLMRIIARWQQLLVLQNRSSLAPASKRRRL